MVSEKDKIFNRGGAEKIKDVNGVEEYRTLKTCLGLSAS